MPELVAVHNISCPTAVAFGPGALDELPDLAAQIGGRKALLVSGRRFARQTGLIDRITEGLSRVGVGAEVFARVEPSPRSGTVDLALEALREAGCDLVVGLGGGSAMDVAKFAGMLATNGGSCVDYEAGRPVREPSLPVIAVATTAGSGSEVTPYSVINSSSTGRKFTIAHRRLCPRFAVVDPGLTAGRPRETTLASGLDAWLHALEGYLSAGPNPVADLWAERAVRLAYGNLAEVLKRPDDPAGRANMSLAALLGGWTISQVRTGMIHTLSAALAPHVELPHGLLNAVVAPQVLAFNSGRYGARLRRAAGWLAGREALADEQATRWLRGWLEGLGVPAGLASFGLDDGIVPGLIERVNQDEGLKAANVRPFGDADLAVLCEHILHAREAAP